MTTRSRTPILAATEHSIREGRRSKRITAADAGAVALVRMLARQLDADAPEVRSNIASAYLRACNEMGLTPAGRKRVDEIPKAVKVEVEAAQRPAPEVDPADRKMDELRRRRQAAANRAVG